MKFKKLCLFSFICYFNGELFGDQPDKDPLVRMNYREAFDQSKIQENFRDYLTRSHCDGNVFGVDKDADFKSDIVSNPDSVVIDIPEISEMEGLISSSAVERSSDGEFKTSYEKECLKKLYNARRWAITEAARDEITKICLLAGGVAATLMILPEDSFGGSLGVLWVLGSAAEGFQPAIRAGYNLLITPAHPLNALEEEFAKKQCFIPKQLWPIIVEKFMIARTNQFEQRTSIDFIKFVLGLTMYKPIKQLSIDSDTIKDKMACLFDQLDRFFDNYSEKESDYNKYLLKVNISRFISILSGNTNESPRYIYLHGLGGIGKTYFVEQFCKWIEEIFSDVIYFESCTILSQEELEGSSNTPGAFLRVLRNQLNEGKSGAVIFMDEATFLNDDSMVSTAKRVFNGDQSKLSTSYFGSGTYGSGIELDMSPTLAFVASNDEIKDPALKTRFDVIEFPEPKQEKLIEYAKDIASKSWLLQDKCSGKLEEFDFVDWVKTSKINNFRDIKSNVEAAVLDKGTIRIRRQISSE